MLTRKESSDSLVPLHCSLDYLKRLYATKKRPLFLNSLENLIINKELTYNWDLFATYRQMDSVSVST